MSLKLRRFQDDDYERVWGTYGGRALIAWSQGLGKTVVSLKSIRDEVRGPAVVVCPAGLRLQWLHEAERHVDIRGEILLGRTPRRRRLPRGDGLFVISYDVMRAPSARKRTWVELLEDIEPSIVVCDESQYVKERGAKRSKGVNHLCRNVPHVLFLSGTPMPSRPIEMWHQLSILKPELFPSEFMYGIRYCAGFKTPYGRWDYTGSSNEPELNKIITGDDGCVVRRLKEDVLQDLPPVTETVVPFELPPTAMRDYEHAVDDFLGWLDALDSDRAARARAAEAVAKIGYLKRLAASHKLPMVEAWVRDFLDGTDEKLTIYAIHHNVVGPLFSRFRDQAVMVDGTMSDAEKFAAQERFNTDRRCRLYVANMQAGGVGWSCRSASEVAFAELDWVPASHEQARDRCRGLFRGTGRPVNIHYLVADGTIETDLCATLQKRSDSIAAVLDGRPTGAMRVFDLLVSNLRSRAKPKVRRGLPRR